KQSHSKWFQEAKDIVIDLNYLMEYLRYMKSFNSRWYSAAILFKPTLQFLITADKLRLLMKGEETKVEEAVVSNDKDEKRKFAYKVFDKSTMFGRGKEKKEIIDQLLNMNNSAAVPAVIVIVGVPGIGKTKLARLVCEDEQVKANFGFQPIWIDGLQHETVDVESIAKRVTTTDGKR
ncbi:CC-NBS-LRR resistance protein, partial [Trifolium medium]|nr:CC-NBS-LRR resistance protein [Trifolium medium]